MPLPEADVLSALSSNRSHISDCNRRAFSTIIPIVEAATPDDPDLFGSEEQVEEARLDFILRIIGADPHDVQPPIARPSDVLAHWDELVPQLALDGVSVSLDASWHAEMREICIRGMLKGLNEKCSGLVANWEFPTDFAVILKHADSLEGPGWYRFRAWSQSVVFFEGGGQFGRRDSTEDKVAQQIRAPGEITDQLGLLTEEYEIAAAWLCSETRNEATCYITYSRPRGAEEGRDWSWRYVACLGQFGVNVYEDAVELLEWHKSYNEHEEPAWNITDQEVFDV